MSRAHTHLLRQINARLAEERYCRGSVEHEDPATFQDDYGDDYFDDSDDHDTLRCSVCAAELDGGIGDECDMCGMPGCGACLHSGDDMYPSLCSECAGYDDEDDTEMDLADEEVEA